MCPSHASRFTAGSPQTYVAAGRCRPGHVQDEVKMTIPRAAFDGLSRQIV